MTGHHTDVGYRYAIDALLDRVVQVTEDRLRIAQERIYALEESIRIRDEELVAQAEQMQQATETMAKQDQVLLKAADAYKQLEETATKLAMVRKRAEGMLAEIGDLFMEAGKVKVSKKELIEAVKDAYHRAHERPLP